MVSPRPNWTMVFATPAESSNARASNAGDAFAALVAVEDSCALHEKSMSRGRDMDVFTWEQTPDGRANLFLMLGGSLMLTLPWSHQRLLCWHVPTRPALGLVAHATTSGRESRWSGRATRV